MSLAIFMLVLAGWSARPAAAGDTSWMFLESRYSHSPTSGARVNQYRPEPMIAALPDARPYMSGYRRSRVTLRGADGTVDSYYRVENWSNGRGGIDAEWERVNDVWQQSVLSGGFGYGGYGYGGGYGGPHPGYGGPYAGYGPYPGYGGWGGGYGAPGGGYYGGAPGGPGNGPGHGHHDHNGHGENHGPPAE